MRFKIFIAIISIVAVGLGSYALWRTRISKVHTPVGNTVSTSSTPPEVRAAVQTIETNWRTAVSSTVKIDLDLDGLTDAEESSVGTNKNSADTDGDGVSDYIEVKKTHTNPLKADTDGDKVNDGLEIKRHTNPQDTKSF